jgi:hypothetical protein
MASIAAALGRLNQDRARREERFMLALTKIPFSDRFTIRAGSYGLSFQPRGESRLERLPMKVALRDSSLRLD